MNWTIENISLFIAFFPFLISFLVLFKEYRRYYNRSLLYLMFGWLFYGIYWVVEGLSYLLLNPHIFIFRGNLMILVAYCVVISFDFMSQDRIDYKKTSIVTALGVLTIVTSLMSNAYEPYVYPNGDQSYSTSGLFFVSLLLLSLLNAGLFCFYMGKILIRAPAALKKDATISFIGSIILGPLSLVFYMLRVSVFIPGIIPLTTGVGSLIMTLIISKHPQLAYLVPVKLIKLVIIDEKTGYKEFVHHWITSDQKTSQLEDLLFASLINQIINLFNDVLGESEVREIHIKDAEIHISRIYQYPHLIILFTSKTTNTLRNQFSRFVKELSKNLDQLNPKTTIEKTIKHLDQDALTKLVNDCFPHIPIFAGDSQIPSLIERNLSDIEMQNQKAENKLSEKNITSLCISCNKIKTNQGNWMNLIDYYQESLGNNLVWESCPSCSKIPYYLILSYFDDISGPTIIFQIPEQNLPRALEKIPFLIDLNYSGFFSYAIENYQILNYAFSIFNPNIRGKQIPFLISLTASNIKINEEFAHHFLNDCINEIKESFQSHWSILTSKDKREGLGSQNAELKEVYDILMKNYLMISNKKMEFYIKTQKLKNP